MPFESDFLDLMPHNVLVSKRSSTNIRGESTFGPDVSYRARIERRNRLVRNSQGQEALSTTTIYIAGSPGISSRDRITLPDGSQPIILSVASNPDESGAHHEVVYT